jgi:hypothetical protein
LRGLLVYCGDPERALGEAHARVAVWQIKAPKHFGTN